MEHPPCRPEELYGPLLSHCAHLAKEQMRRRLEAYDLTPSQTSVLLYLGHHGPAVQTALAESMRVKAPTVGGLLDRMAEKGLVRRTVDPRDARCRTVELTEKGEGLVSEIREQFAASEAAILRGFTPEEAAALKAFLRRIIVNLEEPL